MYNKVVLVIIHDCGTFIILYTGTELCYRPSVVLKQIGSGKNHRVLENQCYSYAGGLGLGLHITGTLSLEVCGHYLIDVTALTTMCCCN